MSNEIQKYTPSQTKTKLWLDLVLFTVFLVAMEPRSSGLAIHEWLTLSLAAVIIVHLLLSWDWIAGITQRFLGKMGLKNRINYVLNWLLFIDGTLLIVSGVMISQIAMPAIGIQLPFGFAWRGLHNMSANLALIILGVHTALHWSWIVNTFDKYLVQPFVKLFMPKRQKDISE